MSELDQEPTPKPGIDYTALTAIVWRERKRIFLFSFIIALVTFAINWFVLTLYFKSTTTVLPATDKTQGGAMGQLAGLAAMAGVSVGGSGEVSKLYPIILSSETVLRKVIETRYGTKEFSDSVDLIQYFEIEEDTREEAMDKALKKVRGLMTSSADNKTSVVTASVEMPEPQLAADVLNNMVKGLDQFMRQKRMGSASEQAKWISARLAEVEKELKVAEERLKDFRERNRRVADSPELLLQQERLQREVLVKSTIFTELKKQYELAKIEEIKNITIVNVLDEARAPVKKERPKRATNAMIAFMLGFVGLSAYFVGKEMYGEKVRGFVKGMKGERG